MLIIGSGIAGFANAYYIRRYCPSARITIATKTDLLESSTRHAQGGIACVWASPDSLDDHIQDTLNAGAGLCHPEIVALCVSKGAARLEDLIHLGVPFTRKDAAFDLHREGGHSHRRILHVDDQTGSSIHDSLLRAVLNDPLITCRPYMQAIELLHDANGTCRGAHFIEHNTTITADITVLATGGTGRLYAHTSNPETSTGDGIALAFLAGARVANLEMMQFHPTLLWKEGSPFLITEALRGEGAELITLNGHAFTKSYHPLGSLAPRDSVSQAIVRECLKTHDSHVLLDCSSIHEEHFAKRFPVIFKTLQKNGIYAPKQPIPVFPAAHYTCGGILVNAFGQSDIPSLYAVGETASTGLHGANRLASNSLLEALVFAHEAAYAIAGHTNQSLPPIKVSPLERGTPYPMQALHKTLWDNVGILRTQAGLQKAQEDISSLHHTLMEEPASQQRRLAEHMLLLGNLMVQSALLRKESRGVHALAEFPEKNNIYCQDTILGLKTL